ncbi:cobalamin B12-binding domain-containing protein [Sphingomonas sp. 1P06PA]|uniref:cobalamin B12-binding domain-containing protein n=1 Tax=Sphingomonas sp. 1P06PA TaxID=554121 RepID=UPI0039A469BB
MATVIGTASPRTRQSGAAFRSGPAPGRSRPRTLPLGQLAPSPAALATLIEGQIIPRLMLANGVAPRAPAHAIAGAAEDIVPLALGIDADALLARVETILAEGVTIERLMVDLLAPAARRLGELWHEDRCDFVEVTMGLWRLQEVVREVSAATPPVPVSGQGRSALFAALPGDQHGFGAVLVDEAFRRSGWDSDLAVGLTMPELLRRVGASSYALLGLTVSCDCHIARLPSMITALRSVSANPRVSIMVGGRVFVDDPDLAGRVGADGTAADAFAAVAIAEDLVIERMGAMACG